jgi:hypothetical protein
VSKKRSADRKQSKKRKPKRLPSNSEVPTQTSTSVANNSTFPPADQPTLVEKWLKALKNNPALAVIIFAAIILMAILVFLTDAFEKTRQLITDAQQVAGRPTREELKTQKECYDLGKNVAWETWYHTLIGPGKTVPPQVAGVASEHASEISTAFDTLDLKCDIKTLDFSPMMDFNPWFAESTASSFIGDQISLKHNKKAEAAFHLGLDVQMTEDNALSQIYKVNPPPLYLPDAAVEIKDLNSEAVELGAKPVDLTKLNGKDDPSFNFAIGRIVDDIDSNIADAWGD